MNKYFYLFFSSVCIIFSFFGLFFAGCSNNDTIKMYDITTKKIIKMKFEDYVARATAAEMDESFATAALQTQAILCRTFAKYFINNRLCKYKGADISNDITEAQGYSKNVPERIKNAVTSTKGQIFKCDGKLVLPYYCSNCGGKNSLATDIFNASADYINAVDTLETSSNSKNYAWSAQVNKADILNCLRSLGVSLANVNTFKVNTSDQSGRALTFNIGGAIVNANKFRLCLGSTMFKSCLLTNIVIATNTITFEGLGYGHGVGLSQWTANILAQDNYTAKDIIEYFYKNSEIVKI